MHAHTAPSTMSRLRVLAGERTYHLFYALCAANGQSLDLPEGMAPISWDKLQLEPADSYTAMLEPQVLSRPAMSHFLTPSHDPPPHASHALPRPASTHLLTPSHDPPPYALPRPASQHPHTSRTCADSLCTPCLPVFPQSGGGSAQERE